MGLGLVVEETAAFEDPWLSVFISRWIWLYIEEVLSSQQGKLSPIRS
jgi:hypothetical protein